MKNILEFELDGKPVYMEVEESDTDGLRPVTRGDEGFQKAQTRFTEAIDRVRPAAVALLNSFREMDTPDEIGLEFGIKFSAKAGAVFASVDSEATFKVSL